jgi:hypothetical protein
MEKCAENIFCQYLDLMKALERDIVPNLTEVIEK